MTERMPHKTQVAEKRLSRASNEGRSFDAVIVGAGPVGLSSTLILGRCWCRVLICDTGQHRNEHSQGVHAFLTQDGIAPAELLRLGREQLRQYDTVTFCAMEVRDINGIDGRFTVLFPDGSTVCTRKVLLATGVVDVLPEMPNIEQYYGRSVSTCRTR